MPIYMLNIVYDPTLPPPEGPSRQPRHAALTEEMRARGHHVAGAGLAPVRTFERRVRRSGAGPMFLDGPFAETKEALGGFFLVRCTEEEALEYAGRIDIDPHSWISVRRVGIYQPPDGPVISGP
jgi:hypothetical protein